MSELLTQVKEDMKAAMRAKEKERLATIRMLLAEVKRKEVDERIEIDDAMLLAIVDKMVKQRKDSAQQYFDANREDLAQVELAEIEILKQYLPEPLTDEALADLIQAAIIESGAATMQDMGKVMALLKPQVQGRADMKVVSALIKSKLS